LHRTPLDVATVFRGYRSRRRAAWVFTSATLAVGESFQHFADLVGAENAATALWRSPFDYRRQALLYLPKGLPDPASGAYDEAVASVARKVLAASRGRVFCLFTSHRALRTTARVLGTGLRYPLMIQGDAPRAELIERFRRAGDAVLLGTSSFWEGVDVRGDALSCVLIDRLPFAPPSDPLLQGRIDHLRRSGGRPFPELQLPRAVIALKQGAGRLIRDQHDSGVLVLCDPRLRTRGYGRVFLTSLPEMPLTENLADVERFLQPPVDHPATAEGSARALGEIDAARP
jgi:ATP-dependent DNA helicase DinG